MMEVEAPRAVTSGASAAETDGGRTKMRSSVVPAVSGAGSAIASVTNSGAWIVVVRWAMKLHAVPGASNSTAIVPVPSLKVGGSTTRTGFEGSVMSSRITSEETVAAGKPARVMRRGNPPGSAGRSMRPRLRAVLVSIRG